MKLPSVPKMEMPDMKIPEVPEMKVPDMPDLPAGALELANLLPGSAPKISTTVAALNLIKSCLGGCVIVISYLLTTSGVITGSLVMLLIAIAMYYAYWLYNAVLQDIGKEGMNIEDMIKEVQGETWAKAYKALMVLFAFGIGCSYMIFMTVYFKILVTYVTGERCSEEVGVAGVTVVSFFLVLIRNQDTLKYLASIGMVFVMVNYFAFTIHAMTRIDHHENNHVIDHIYLYGTSEGTLKAIGGFYFAFEYVSSISYIRKEMKNSQEFMKVVGITQVFSFLLLCSFGVMHSLSVPVVNSIFFLDFEPQKNLWVFGLQSTYFFVIACTLPINANACFLPFEDITAYKAVLFIKGNPWWLKNIFRFIGIMFMMVLVSIAPDMEVVVNITGGLFGTAIAFIFSTQAYNTHFAKSISTSRKVCNNLVMLVGYLAGVFSVFYKVIDGAVPSR